MCKKLFEEIEERKQHFERLDSAYKRKKRTEAEKTKVQEEILKEDLKAWEENREKRVESWRNFSDKKQRIEKKKKTHFGIKAPPVKQEERPEYARVQVDLDGKPLGIQDEYKKQCICHSFDCGFVCGDDLLFCTVFSLWLRQCQLY